MPTVLLVDDDPDNHTLLTVWLQRMGHRVLNAASAVEALRLLDEHGVPDLAILDIVMHQISGLELLDHLRRHNPASATLPAILLTARHLSSDQEAAGTLNAMLLTKPLERARLAAAVEQVLHPVGL
jgi:CheY-like chemotaxis protein